MRRLRMYEYVNNSKNYTFVCYIIQSFHYLNDGIMSYIVRKKLPTFT